MAQPNDPIPTHPNVKLVIETPRPQGKPYDIVYITNLTGIYPLSIYDEGGCQAFPGCRYFNNQFYKLGDCILVGEHPTRPFVEGEEIAATVEYKRNWVSPRGGAPKDVVHITLSKI